MADMIVSLARLERLWTENHIEERRAAGEFIEIVTPPSEAGDPRFAGEYSVVVLLKTKDRRHIGTFHQMIDANGNILNSPGYRHPPHPKAFRAEDGTLYRIVEKQEMTPQPRKRRQRR